MVHILLISTKRMTLSRIQASRYPCLITYAANHEETKKQFALHPDVICFDLENTSRRLKDLRMLTGLLESFHSDTPCRANGPTFAQGYNQENDAAMSYARPPVFLLNAGKLCIQQDFAFYSKLSRDVYTNPSRFFSIILARLAQNSPAQDELYLKDKTAPYSLTHKTPPLCPYPSSMLVGISDQIRRVRKEICTIARYPDSVLIQGESGTGKDVAANLLHNISGKSGPLISLNCAALPQSLAEAELFGYDKGSFTNAEKTHKGVFEQAAAGSLFLDEIGDMPSSLQPKLLRVLEDKTVLRIGSAVKRKINVRIISATNVSLNGTTAGNPILRRDLQYRISTLYINIPPLRERREDILCIADWYLKKNGISNGNGGLTDESRKLISNYSWPGNVRQLFSALRKGIIFSDETDTEKRNCIRIDPSMLNSDSIQQHHTD